METDELPPSHGLFALRGRRDTIALEDIVHRLIADCIAQMVQGTLNAIIVPRAIFPRYAYHQVFNLFVNTGTANRCACVRGGNLLVGEFTVPSQDGIRRGNGGALYQSLLSQLRAHIGEYVAVAICEQYATVDLLAENRILRCQVCIVKPDFCTNRLFDRPQQVFQSMPRFAFATPSCLTCSVWAMSR